MDNECTALSLVKSGSSEAKALNEVDKAQQQVPIGESSHHLRTQCQRSKNKSVTGNAMYTRRVLSSQNIWRGLALTAQKLHTSTHQRSFLFYLCALPHESTMLASDWEAACALYQNTQSSTSEKLCGVWAGYGIVGIETRK